jgi:hypothetical protein
MISDVPFVPAHPDRGNLRRGEGRRVLYGQRLGRSWADPFFGRVSREMDRHRSLLLLHIEFIYADAACRYGQLTGYLRQGGLCHCRLGTRHKRPLCGLCLGGTGWSG